MRNINLLFFGDRPEILWLKNLTGKTAPDIHIQQISQSELNNNLHRIQNIDSIVFSAFEIPEIANPSFSEILNNSCTLTLFLPKDFPDEKKQFLRTLQIDYVLTAGTVELEIDIYLKSLSKLKKLKEELHESKSNESKYKLLFEESPGGILLIEENGKTIEANPKAAEQLGYDLSEFKKLNISDYEAKETSKETENHLQNIIQNKQEEFETLHKTKGGEIRNVHVSTKFISLDHKNYFLSIFQDITDRKRDEEEILHEKVFNEAAMNSLPGLFYLFDDQGKFLRWNKNFEIISGYSAEEISKISPVDLFRGNEKEYIYGQILEVFEKGESDAVAHFTSKDETSRLHYFTGKKLRFQGKLCLVGMGIDITQKKAAEDELAFRNIELSTLNELSKEVSANVSLGDRIQIIIEQISNPLSSDVTLLFLKEGPILKLAGKGPKNSKYPHEVANLHKVGECLCGIAAHTKKPVYSMDILSDFRCTYEECKKAGLVSFASIPLLEGDEVIGVIGVGTGAPKDFQKSSSFLETAAKEIVLSLKNARLFEEIKELNKDLEARVQARTRQLEETNKEIESFSFSVSHDLRAPLRAIDGWSEALFEDYFGKLDEKAQKYLQRIRSETNRMGILIEDLLRLSKLTRTEMHKTNTNLSQMAKKISERLLETQKGRQIEFISGENITANVDPNLLDVALTNLIDNAFKFTGKIDNPKIEFGKYEQAGEEVFFVRDNGSGFNMIYSEKLFGPFQRMHKTSEFPGTGIGLTIVQRIIHKHGGRIWAESEIRKGTTFYFTLEERI